MVATDEGDIMAKITLEFDEERLSDLCKFFDETNDAINGMGDANAYESTYLFEDNDEARLLLAETLYDAYREYTNS
jgi:hypothetical protein